MEFTEVALVIGGIALLVAASLAFQFTMPKEARAESASPKSIALLPFENLNSDRDDIYFAQGNQDGSSR